jgi:hypothetical protein
MVAPSLQRTSKRIIVRPLVVFAAKCLGPGPLRLQMVKFAHDLDDGDNYFDIFYAGRRPEAKPAFEAPASRTARRAA